MFTWCAAISTQGWNHELRHVPATLPDNRQLLCSFLAPFLKNCALIPWHLHWVTSQAFLLSILRQDRPRPRIGQTELKLAILLPQPHKCTTAPSFLILSSDLMQTVITDRKTSTHPSIHITLDCPKFQNLPWAASQGSGANIPWYCR